MLEAFGPSLYVADGPTVSFFGFPYPTRMAVVRLRGGDLWVWSPVALTPALDAALSALGPVRHLVSPNKLHHLFLAEWLRRWPDARLHVLSGLARRMPHLPVDALLGDAPHPAWAADVDQVIVRGSLLMDEAVFFHRASRTAIVGDLVQRHDPARLRGLGGMIMRLDGMAGEHGSTPREWRLTFLRRRAARTARATVLAWSPEQLVVAHGLCARADATGILTRALAWI